MTEPRIRPERFTTQPGEVRIGKFDADGRWRPLTAAEARDRGVTDYDPATGKVGPDVRGVRRLGLRAGRGRLEEPRHGAALGRRPGRVVRHHPARLPASGEHHVCGRRAPGRQFGREPDPSRVAGKAVLDPGGAGCSLQAPLDHRTAQGNQALARAVRPLDQFTQGAGRFHDGRGRWRAVALCYAPDHPDLAAPVVFDIAFPPGATTGPAVDLAALNRLSVESSPRWRAAIAAHSILWQPGVTRLPIPGAARAAVRPVGLGAGPERLPRRDSGRSRPNGGGWAPPRRTKRPVSAHNLPGPGAPASVLLFAATLQKG